MKTKNIIIFIAAGLTIILAVYFFTSGDTEKRASAQPVQASTEAQRLGYLASHGWKAQEIAEKDIIIPEIFSESYEEYVKLQDKQSLPLREYAGKQAKLYVYSISNYSPENKDMLAEIIVCEDIIAASMVYSSDSGSIRMAVS